MRFLARMIVRSVLTVIALYVLAVGWLYEADLAKEDSMARCKSHARSIARVRITRMIARRGLTPSAFCQT